MIERTEMNLLAATAVTLSLLASTYAQTNQAGAISASAQDPQAIRIARRGTQPSRQGPAENFTGSVRVDPLFQANAPAPASAVLLHFARGARAGRAGGVAYAPARADPDRDGGYGAGAALGRSR